VACDDPLPLETEPLDCEDDEEEDESVEEVEEVDESVVEDAESADGTTAATTSPPARLTATRPPVTPTTWRCPRSRTDSVVMP
jgi:hypothetical protein